MSAAPKAKSRLSRYSRATKPVPLSLTRRDEDIRQGIEDLGGFVTASQVCRWVFGSESALSYCRERLKKLFHAHLVDRLFYFRGPHGSPLTIYTLKRRNPVNRSQYFLEHTLALTDFILALRSYGEMGQIQLVSVIPERELRKEPIRVRVESKDTALIPDCYVSLRLLKNGQVYELNLAVEIDRATESLSAFRQKKVRSYLAFADGPFQRTFNSTALTVVVITTAGEKRVTTLTQALEQELTAVARRDQADLFRIGSADFANWKPGNLFTDRRFRVPFQQEPIALIPEL